ncbi:MAG TPA: glycosyl hydrolase, partial [Ohtaekwangia sp.]|nr:glycosyl hydrolase [Ohtaekwangia sp.]
TPSDGSAMRVDPKQIDIQKILQPVSANNNLQALALDQVKFERMLDLKALMAYSDRGETIDLFDKVDANNKLRWTAPQGNWKLYAVFEGWHGKMVERAGPGGEGNVIDHFSSQALKQYLNRFDSAFRRNDITSLRAFFNDSYEVDDARGAADWTPELFSIFQKNRGYDLRHHIPAWLGQDAAEKNERVLSDYRQTISELVHDNFTLPWKSWAHRNGAIIRNQAHGAPANILDLYAAVDIPEIEGIEPLRIKMASSAGNIAGKKLVSSESATWLDEHFKSNLGDIKVAADRFMLHGVNHIFYHGTCYSPPNDPWPGRLFYAAVHLNPRNPMWRDFDALNEYVTRCQSLLQRSRADQDILVYFPIHDRFATPGAEMLEHFDGVGKQFENTAFREASEHMLEKGFAFDFISDQQVLNTRCDNGRLKTEGGNSYKVILIPHSRYIPVETLEQIVTLAKEGATVIFYRGLPESFAGYANLDANRKKFNDLIATLPASGALQTGKGKIFSGTDLAKLLEQSGVRREAMTDLGIQYLRKITPEGEREYFISNGSNDQFTGWIPLGTPASSVTILDPVSGRIGSGNTRTVNGITEVFVSLSSRQSMFIRSTKRDTPEKFNFYKPVGEPVALRGPWSVTFTEGGPVLPESLEIDTLTSWTMFPQDACQAFSGTAAYTITFNKPQQKSSWWLLDLGRVNESAEVLLNGKPVATLIGPTYRVMIDDRQMKPDNILEIRVSNLMANRIADLDKRQVFWKKFYNVNFPARMAENRVDGLFNAAHWAPEDSGLVGPVTISATGVAED